MSSESLRITFSRFLIVVLFAVAFAYIESAVVVYLRAIFYPGGFAFPLRNLLKVDPAQKYLVLTEIGREAATLVLILAACILFGRNGRQRFAYFIAIFAVWDIFYYVWLKVILDWPASIMDWDILFMIPAVWASAVLYPLIISALMLAFAVVILHRDAIGKPIAVTPLDWLIFAVASVVIVASLCTAGPYMDKVDYQAYFYWPLFALGAASAVAAFARCVCRPQQSPK
ncbi:MAG: hypothetical protein JXN61_09725 [Sedimentisphaerales bacterium]|nr:hypothetical protein [Sedimentisphaerales bacterium]